MVNEDKFSLRSLLLKVALVVVFILLLLWFFPMPNMKPIYDRLFAENIESMRRAAKSYFTIERLPSKAGERVIMTLDEMITKKLVLPLVDSDGNFCDSRSSQVEVTKTDTEYLIRITLSCSTRTDYIIEHFGCYDICPTICIPTEEVKRETQTYIATEKKVAKKVIKSQTKKDKEPEKDPEKQYLYEYQKSFSQAYSSWSPWSNKIKYTDSDNIQFGCSDLKCTEPLSDSPHLEQVGIAINYGTKFIEHIVYHQIGTYTQRACANYQYVKYDNYEYVVGSWKSPVEVKLASRPKDTISTKYEFIGFDITACQNICEGTAYMKFRKYERDIIKVSGPGSITVTCTDYVYKQIPIFGTKVNVTSSREIINIEKVYEDVKYYHYKTRSITKEAYNDLKWSFYNDRGLLDTGYTYTGNKKVK